ncbi:MAG: tRNA pseudouridine(55) synthase TruB [Deltaproteobacteria bacterium]
MSEDIHGILSIDKPSGMTSFHVVRLVKKALRAAKAGHAGTLDPMATGVLPICLGKATKLSASIMDGEKIYEGIIRLGITTDTFDAEGSVLAERPVPALSRERIAEVARSFEGPIKQVPPAFSAVKYKGKPLYSYARKGIFIEKGPRVVMVHSFEILDWNSPDIFFRIVCGKGTYVRSLAHELGERLECGGYLHSLRRLKSGPCTIERSVTIDAFLEAVDKGRLAEILAVPDAGLRPFVPDSGIYPQPFIIS